jgi:putative phosphoribosyl transferase
MAFFSDRIDAGKRLANALKGHVSGDTVVLAIPRGGVVVGFEVARELCAPLDVIVPRKIGAPNNPELAIGAVTQDGTLILDRQLMRYLGVSEAYVQTESQRQKVEIERRVKSYRGDLSAPNLKGCTVIVVDDGIATGSTMKAALASVRKSGAECVVVAVPVGPASTIAALQSRADLVVCLFMPQEFNAIGEFYENFEQTTDEEVRRLLSENRLEARKVG